MPAQFKPGELVTLRSDNMPMAVGDVFEQGGTWYATCHWRDKRNDLQEKPFPESVLKRYERPRPVRVVRT